VTVVVSLTAFGNDFLGGLYVATSDDANHSFVALQTGDAVVHQSDLLHGVDVISGDRYSWVLWLKDSKGCSSSPADWQRQAADDGDPVASFLQAHRAHMQPGISAAAAAVKKFKWLRAAAKAGFSRAQNELGVAYMNGDGVAANLQTAKMWLRRASKFEPDANFNLALLLLHTSSSPNKLAEAVALFAEAAEAGSRSAMFNLGVAYFKGRGVDVDFDLAEHWFTKEGSAEASYSIAQMYVACRTCRGSPARSPAFWRISGMPWVAMPSVGADRLGVSRRYPLPPLPPFRNSTGMSRQRQHGRPTRRWHRCGWNARPMGGRRVLACRFSKPTPG